MLRADKPSMWGRTYEITHDDTPVSTFSPSLWRTGGRIEIDGREYRIGANFWGHRYAMTDAADQVVASADRVGRKDWTVEADGRTYRFRRASFWSQDQSLVQGDQEIGSVRKASWWRSSAEADLPGLSLPAQLFVVAVVLTMWEQNAAAASSGGGG